VEWCCGRAANIGGKRMVLLAQRKWSCGREELRANCEKNCGRIAGEKNCGRVLRASNEY
jgi:hypothetical protein